MWDFMPHHRYKQSFVNKLKIKMHLTGKYETANIRAPVLPSRGPEVPFLGNDFDQELFFFSFF